MTTNPSVADRLDEIASLLADQGANDFRVRAYRHAANVVRGLGEPVGALVAREGVEGLDRLPGIGPSLASTIAQLAATGHVAILDRLRGEVDPERLFASVPGVGPMLARRLHEAHGLDTLEELEAAAHDGRLGRIPGFGVRRVEAVRAALAARLGRAGPPAASAASRPSVAELLSVDHEYRERARQGELPLIAPRRFNPLGERWLPVLHTRRGDRQYTALFSNTAQAHRFGRTHDWVVLYHDDEGAEHRHTVVTARLGPMKGWRVVRDREQECWDHYGLSRAGRQAGRPDGPSRIHPLAPGA